MPRFAYKIGTSAEGMTYTEQLATPFVVGLAPFVPYQEYLPTPDLGIQGIGPAQVTWRMGFMTRAQRDQARVFCPGPSAKVFISTKINDDANYHTFETMMHWPLEEDRQTNRLLDTVWKFTVIQEIEEES